MALWLHGKSATTIGVYRAAVRQFLEFAGKTLADIKLEDLQLWERGLELRFRPDTRRTKILAVKSLLSFAVRVGYLDVNIGTLVKAPKSRDVLPEKILTESEVKRLVAAPGGGRDRSILTLMYALGLRVSELINLRWTDIRSEAITIVGKGNKTRFIAVTPQILAILPPKTPGCDYVFPNRSGGKMTRQNVNRMIKKYSEKAGIDPKTSPHYLRHCHASHSLKNGASLRLIQTTLGHSSITITEKYLHISPTESSAQFLDF